MHAAASANSQSLPSPQRCDTARAHRQDGSNALVLAPKAKGGKGSSQQQQAQQQELSKAELRKLKQIQQKKERREGLTQVRRNTTLAACVLAWHESVPCLHVRLPREHAQCCRLTLLLARYEPHNTPHLKTPHDPHNPQPASSQVFTQLQQSSVADERLQLLRPLHMRGAKETKKQRLKRALKLQRAGVVTEAAAELLVERRRPKGTGAGGSSSEQDEDGSGSEEDEEDVGKAARFGQKGAAAAAVAAEAMQDDEGEGDEERSEEEGGHAGQQATKRQKVADGSAAKVGKAAAQAPAVKKQQTEARGKQADADLEHQQQQEQEHQQQRDALLQRAREEAAALRKEHGVTDEDPEEPALRARREKERAAAAAAAVEAAGGGSGVAGPRRVTVERPAGMQEAREGLPILGHEQEVVEAVAVDDVIVLCGETGCGKTTQVGLGGL